MQGRTQLISAVAMLLVFVCMSAVAQIYSPELHALADVDSGLGATMYVVVTVIAVVAAPLASLPLVPMATMMWGVVVTALLSILGWIIGSLIAFYIARKYGRVVVGHLTSLEQIDRVADRVLGPNQLRMIILLRMVIPVDVLSYALGLVGHITWRNYIIGTCVGVVPFAFIFAAASSLPILEQTSFLIGLAAVLGIIYTLIFRKTN